MPAQVNHLSSFTKRVDLHCHSRASTEADEALLLAIQCPESFSEPREVYAQAKRRGMHFVTITDHDSIAGVDEIADRADVLIGEELTCYFPEDCCKMHVLVWGISPSDHDALQAKAADIYACAEYIEHNRIAHAVAHPLYRQNDKLDRWHVERLLLMFKGFECLNGAHSMLHREAFEPLLDALDSGEIHRLERVHGMKARWERPWAKTRTAGSDDHGLFNIGRTWTEFPDSVQTVADLLDCLREGDCRPGGEAGSSLKLAHNFYGVGVRYYAQHIAGPDAAFGSAMMQRLVGDKPSLGRGAMAIGALKHFGGGLLGKAGEALGIRSPRRGTQLLAQLFASAARGRLGEHPEISDALRDGRPALAEHASMFDYLNDIGRHVSEGIAASVGRALDAGEVGAIFDAFSGVLAHQALLLPYYFALFHQNQERHLLSRITGHGRQINRQTLRVGVFTDTFDGDGDAARFARELAEFAEARSAGLVVHTCSERLGDADASEHRRNFKPLVARALPGLGVEGVIPPVLEILEWADRRQFDAIVVNTPGPMGLCGWLVSKMLRVPMLAACHDHLPAIVFGRTGGDYRTTAAARGFASWFHSQAARVLVPSRSGREVMEPSGIAAEMIGQLPPIPARKRPVHSSQQAHACWERHRVREPRRLICPPQINSAQDMDLIADAFELVCRQRRDTALVVAGDGPWTKLLKKSSDLPVYLLEAANQAMFYPGADMFLYPARDIITGGMVVEAQAAGLPVLVSSAGAAREFMDDELTGLVLPADDPSAWASAILGLLDDEPRRQRMARTGMQRIRRLEPSRTFEVIWDECLRVVGAVDPAKSAQQPAVAPLAEVKRA